MIGQNKIESLQSNSTAYLLRMLRPRIHRHFQVMVSAGDLIFYVGAFDRI